MVTVMAMFDAVDLIKDVQFYDVMREDVSVTFETPRGSSALSELRRLPGVRVAESFRAVPVRLRRGAREHKTVVMGLESGAQLRRLRDLEGRVLLMPDHGVLISPVLARVLDAQARQAHSSPWTRGGLTCCTRPSSECPG